jgi:PEP-CTERM motif
MKSTFTHWLAALVGIALGAPAAAEIMEVTFQDLGGVEVLPGVPQPAGPVPVSIAGDFFFDTLAVSGGLLPTFQRAGSAPGAAGTAQVFFGAGPAGTETITYSDGSRLTVPLRSGFALYGDFEAPLCGAFDDCHYSVGQVLTLNQFKGATDPWALIFNGMNGSFGEFFPDLEVSALFPGSGEWTINASGDFAVHSIPEPGTLALLLAGLGGCLLLHVRRRGPAAQPAR